MNLFFCPDLTDSTIILSGDEFIHGIKSLRLKSGDSIMLTNGNGLKATGVLSEVRKREAVVRIEILEEVAPLPFELHLAVAPTKNKNRYEWMAEKCTEIGLHTLLPLICEHSERPVINLMRIENIFLAALKQSQKSHLPKVYKAKSFRDYLDQSEDFEEKFICTQIGEEHLSEIYQGQRKISLLIGPEGDFSNTELALAKEKGYKPVHLGDQKLRTETAGIVAATLIASYHNRKIRNS